MGMWNSQTNSGTLCDLLDPNLLTTTLNKNSKIMQVYMFTNNTFLRRYIQEQHTFPGQCDPESKNVNKHIVGAFTK
jgi:hypothetical protein